MQNKVNCDTEVFVSRDFQTWCFLQSCQLSFASYSWSIIPSSNLLQVPWKILFQFQGTMECSSNLILGYLAWKKEDWIWGFFMSVELRRIEWVELDAVNFTTPSFTYFLVGFRFGVVEADHFSPTFILGHIKEAALKKVDLPCCCESCKSMNFAPAREKLRDKLLTPASYIQSSPRMM